MQGRVVQEARDRQDQPPRIELQPRDQRSDPPWLSAPVLHGDACVAGVVVGETVHAAAERLDEPDDHPLFAASSLHEPPQLVWADVLLQPEPGPLDHGLGNMPVKTPKKVVVREIAASSKTHRAGIRRRAPIVTGPGLVRSVSVICAGTRPRRSRRQGQGGGGH